MTRFKADGAIPFAKTNLPESAPGALFLKQISYLLIQIRMNVILIVLLLLLLFGGGGGYYYGGPMVGGGIGGLLIVVLVIYLLMGRRA